MQQDTATDIAFKNLFDKEYNQLCKYAFSYMQDLHIAEDIVQDTFIKVWELKKELIRSEEIKYYLVTAVRNNCISALRKQNNTVHTDTFSDTESEVFITAIERQQQLTEQQRSIAEALNRLPAKCKEVFLLVKMQGMSYRNAADAMGISIKTVENQMGKAIKIFRELNVQTIASLLVIFNFLK